MERTLWKKGELRCSGGGESENAIREDRSGVSANVTPEL